MLAEVILDMSLPDLRIQILDVMVRGMGRDIRDVPGGFHDFGDGVRTTGGIPVDARSDLLQLLAISFEILAVHRNFLLIKCNISSACSGAISGPVGLHFQ
jgi:hypothetical protein